MYAMTNSLFSAAVSRRTVLAGTAAAGAAAALAACGTSGGGGGATDQPSAGPVTLSAADVPVGGGKIIGEVVVTQPVAGTFKAFSAVCTHQGCIIGGVADGLITCPCHGSAFSDTDGSVKKGPAEFPLPTKTVTESGGSLTVS
jgi:Rieske Fe-S protein